MPLLAVVCALLNCPYADLFHYPIAAQLRVRYAGYVYECFPGTPDKKITSPGINCYNVHGYKPWSRSTVLWGGCSGTFPFLLIRTVYRATCGQSSRSVFGQVMES